MYLDPTILMCYVEIWTGKQSFTIIKNLTLIP